MVTLMLMGKFMALGVKAPDQFILESQKLIDSKYHCIQALKNSLQIKQVTAWLIFLGNGYI